MNKPLRFLVIDDDTVDRQAVTRALKQSLITCQIDQASTALAGLKLAAKQRYDAILLDYRLPDQNGIEVLRTLRAGNIEGVAVLMLSHQEDETLAELCLAAGAQDFLLKDEVNGRRLSRAVRQARQRYLIECQLKSSREKLRQLSENDPLTGLRNRRGFEVAIEIAVARTQRSNDRLAILLLDLDDFKSVNDTLGHDAGDVLLVKFAQRLSGIVRDGDYLCRLGGDEFVVLMTRLEHDEQAILLADRIVNLLQIPIQLGTTQQIVTTSIGIATLGTCADNAVELLKHADIAMYQAKRDGRNQSHFYSAALQETVQAQASMKYALKKALEQHEFRVYYQAQISAVDGSLGGMEALLRWQHPTLGLLKPEAFLSIAEETGIIVDIGNWVLHASCQQLKDWQLRFPVKCPKLAVAVNLSAIQIRHNTLPTAVRSALSEYELEANSLELEITENVLIVDTSATVTMLSSIVAHGVSLSLSEFGTGYSSLEHLKLFPISVLKIDRGFVSSVGKQDKSEQLLMAIIAFAKALEMKVIAEGVETQEQVEFCTQHGCDLLQGYYFSQPIPASEFESSFLM